MAKRSERTRIIESEWFGPLQEDKRGYFGEMDWLGVSVSLYFCKGERTLEEQIELAASLATEQQHWEDTLRSYLKTQIKAGEADYLISKEVEDELLGSLYLAEIDVSPAEGSDDLDLEFSYFSNHPAVMVPEGITDYEFHVGASIKEGVCSFEIRGGD